jgi:hypothetical protein
MLAAGEVDRRIQRGSLRHFSIAMMSRAELQPPYASRWPAEVSANWFSVFPLYEAAIRWKYLDWLLRRRY